MNIARLQKWADHLRTVPRKDFDMGIWCERTECGTVACALGHAAMIPAFRRAGLQFQSVRFPLGDTVRYKEFIESEACEQFFGISNHDAFVLCTFGAKTPKGKAAEIERLIKKAGEERDK